ncbi:hypothetical protein OGAPHI_007024 [Ogataea philodendri]|uniref:Uncharacterized protein n=1 Tax=Ogataea philodendri TaxID=1378263 RepID=A0A9P8SZ74_9ASCO|nr:uncharacterized protein OGAPHI_007024 [Ogataea philodendri]KAH3660438.1 hypothetical protein OGAPHI_007024 [Ogataea philodendri]
MFVLSPNKSPNKRETDHDELEAKRMRLDINSDAPDDTLTPTSSPLDPEKVSKQKLKKQLDEERKLKREQEMIERKLRKEREEEEKRARKEKHEAELRAKREQKEREKLEKQQKREAEAKLREQKRLQEKEEKARRRAEQEDEKARKRAELEEKARKKLEAELEKQRLKELEEQKLKKQSITNFFKPKDSKAIISSSPIKAELQEIGVSDYHKYFLPFNIRSGVRMAHDSLRQSDDLDKFLSGEKTEKESFQDSLVRVEHAPPSFASASEIIQTYNMGMTKEAQEMLDKVPQKYLSYYENGKVPYLGTYSIQVTSLGFELETNPFTKVSSDVIKINYEFDSDLEDDEDDEEGEDVDCDNESDESDDGQSDETSDIEQFVETDENGVATKKAVIGPLVPVVSCLGQPINEQDQFSQYFNSLKYERLCESANLPIDPLFNYWEEEVQEAQTVTKVIEDNKNQASSAPQQNATMTIKKKLITESSHLAKLTAFIMENSDFSINTMTEIAQKQILSDYSKAVVKNSIKELANFDKKTNKWAIKEQAQSV